MPIKPEDIETKDAGRTPEMPRAITLSDGRSAEVIAVIAAPDKTGLSVVLSADFAAFLQREPESAARDEEILVEAFRRTIRHFIQKGVS